MLIRLDRLKPHEKVNPTYLRELKKEIESDGILNLAIAVDRNTNIILDGHHRVAALQELGCTEIPVILVDYDSSNIEVQGQKDGIKLTKEDIIKAGTSLKKLPPKTSRHMIRFSSIVKHVSTVETRVDIPLDDLREKNQ